MTQSRTLPLFALFAFATLRCAHGIAVCEAAHCSSSSACVSYMSVYALCVAIPTPRPDCTCSTTNAPVSCQFTHTIFGSSLKGRFTARNECDCSCRGGDSGEHPVICPAVFSPVCCRANVSGLKRTVNNRCSCESNGQGTVVRDGQCEAATVTPSPSSQPQPTICTAQYDPVCCDVNGVRSTAGNDCSCSGKVLYKGECFEEEPTICPAVFQPVCCKSADTGRIRTVGNKCKCGSGTVLYQGECIARS